VDKRQAQVAKVVIDITLPCSIRIRAWTDSDYAAIQHLSTMEGWPTPGQRPGEALIAWRASWPALVIVNGQEVIGFLRAITDEQVTTYIAEILISPGWRGRGLGQALVETCHHLYPSTRVDLLSTASSDGFYDAIGFRRFQGFRRSYW
jgi:ribosomal protein S18 acetylase RimI-like enzyme